MCIYKIHIATLETTVRVPQLQLSATIREEPNGNDRISPIQWAPQEHRRLMNGFKHFFLGMCSCETNSSQGKRDSMWIEPSIFGVCCHIFHYLFHVIFTKHVHHKKRCTQSITHSKPLSMTNLSNWEKTSQNCWILLGALYRIRSRPDHQHLPACTGFSGRDGG